MFFNDIDELIFTLPCEEVVAIHRHHDSILSRFAAIGKRTLDRSFVQAQSVAQARKKLVPFVPVQLGLAKNKCPIYLPSFT